MGSHGLWEADLGYWGRLSGKPSAVTKPHLPTHEWQGWGPAFVIVMPMYHLVEDLVYEF